MFTNRYLFFLRRISIASGLLFMVLLQHACVPQKGSSVSEGGDTLRLHYAQNIIVVRKKGFTEVNLIDPWNKERLLHRYLLVSRDSLLPDSLPEGTLIRTPMQRLVASTAAHVWLMEELGALDQVIGVCEGNYMHAPGMRKRIANGSIVDCGNPQAPDLEKIIDLEADGVMLSPFEGVREHGKLEDANITIIHLADYMESSGLGRAEWMRFYGMLLGREREADSLFAVVEKRYQAVKEKAKNLPLGPKVLLERPFQGTWYVPGGGSRVGSMLKDVQAQYIFAHITRSGSLPLSIEEVLNQGTEADIWMIVHSGTGPISRKDLLAENEAYKYINAVKENRIYVCNSDITHYFDEVPFRPDLLIADYFQIMHPEMGQDSLRYYKLLDQ